MKRFISILFLLPVFAQERDLNLTLENDSEVVDFKPEDKVVIRLYKKNILNIKLIPDRNMESTIFFICR